MLRYALPFIAALYAFPALAADVNPAGELQKKFEEHQAAKAEAAKEAPPVAKQDPSLEDVASRMVMRMMVEREQLIEQVQQLQAQLKAK